MGDMQECDPRHETWPLFLRTYTLLMDRLESELREARGIPLTWMDVLIQLSKTSDGRMPMNQLAQSVLLSKSGLTRLIDKMVDAGLVTRSACPTDRRVVYASITTKGRAAFDKAGKIHFAGVADHFTSQLSPAETAAFETALRKISDALTAPSEERAAG